MIVCERHLVGKDLDLGVGQDACVGLGVQLPLTPTGSRSGEVHSI